MFSVSDLSSSQNLLAPEQGESHGTRLGAHRAADDVLERYLSALLAVGDLVVQREEASWVPRIRRMLRRRCVHGVMESVTFLKLFRADIGPAYIVASQAVSPTQV